MLAALPVSARRKLCSRSFCGGRVVTSYITVPLVNSAVTTTGVLPSAAVAWQWAASIARLQSSPLLAAFSSFIAFEVGHTRPMPNFSLLCVLAFPPLQPM